MKAINGSNRMKKLTDYLAVHLRSVSASTEAIERFYLNVYLWCLERIGDSRPVLIGINGPQGSGKSTLTRALCEMCELEGYRAVTISIDDFYLTRAEQIRLAQANPDNRYLQNRGYPGTHDLELGTEVLTALKGRTNETRIPRYEKSLYDGKGDRLPENSWKIVRLPLDCIFLEGWMLGFRPVERLLKDPSLAEVNRRLSGYESWHRWIDAFIQLRPRDPRFVLNWRTEAEERTKASGKPGMTGAEIHAYIETFLPAYELYLPGLSRLPVSRQTLVLDIGSDRITPSCRSITE